MSRRIWTTARKDVVVDTDIMAAGDAIGGLISFKVPSSGVVHVVVVTDAGDVLTMNIRAWMFETEPAGVATNAPFALTDADLERLVGISVLNTSKDAINGRLLFEPSADTTSGIPYVAPDGLLWLQLEQDGAGTPTFNATDDVKVKLFIEY